MAKSTKLLTLAGAAALTLGLAACDDIPRNGSGPARPAAAVRPVAHRPSAPAPALLTPAAAPDAGGPLLTPEGTPAPGNVVGRGARSR